MKKITFSSQKVMSDQLSNKSGNLSRKLYDMDNSIASNGSQTIPLSLGSEIVETNSYSGGVPENPLPSAFGLGSQENGQLQAYLNQVMLSSYYQNNPHVVLGTQNPLGGPTQQRETFTEPEYTGGIEHFSNDNEEHPFIDYEEPEETENQVEQLLYLIGTGVVFTGLAGLTVALTYSQTR